MRYVLLIVLLLAGCNSYEKKLSVKEQYAGKEIFVYIFDDKTQLWNRATVEMLSNADCAKIRLLTRQQNGGGM